MIRNRKHDIARACRALTLVVIMMAVACAPALAAKAAAPAATPYQAAVDAAYAKFKDLQEGKNADYIPADRKSVV